MDSNNNGINFILPFENIVIFFFPIMGENPLKAKRKQNTEMKKKKIIIINLEEQMK